MPSSLFRSQPASPASKPDALQMISKLKEFAKGMTPQQARTRVIEMLNKGQITKSQFEALSNQARNLMSFLK